MTGYLAPEKAYFLKNAVLRLAIEVFQTLGGHVHRLQGDGLFAQFVRRDGDPRATALAALDATSMFLFLITNHLNPNILQPALDPIAVRVGIDFGNDEQVLWARYGSSYCEEYTTTGLHVDLAAKLQSHAPGNGIMIGENLRALLDLQEEYVSVRERTEGGERVKKHSIRMQPKGHDFEYKVWQFDWKLWTRHLKWLSPDEGCTVRADSGDSKDGPFYQPLLSGSTLPKGKWIRFTADNVPVHAHDHRWRVVNQGVEAVRKGQKHNTSNGTVMFRHTDYSGYHFAFFRALAYGREVAVGFFAVRVL